MDYKLESGAPPDDDKRPCCVRVLEGLYLVSLLIGMAVAPAGVRVDAALWLGTALLAVLAVSRLRLAIAWLGMSACCIGLLLFIPVNFAFYLTRADDGGWVLGAMLAAIAFAGMTLRLLWSRKTTDWMRAGGGKLSMLVI